MARCRSTRRNARWPSRDSAARSGRGDIAARYQDTSVSWLASTVENMDTDRSVVEFFDRYAAALLERDENAIATMYAVPGLILFPGQSLVVDDPGLTRRFFAGNWGQYAGVTEAVPGLDVVAATDHSVWVKVDWAYRGQVRERFVYQLVRTAGGGWQIAVLTPLAS